MRNGTRHGRPATTPRQHRSSHGKLRRVFVASNFRSYCACTELKPDKIYDEIRVRRLFYDLRAEVTCLYGSLSSSRNSVEPIFYPRRGCTPIPYATSSTRKPRSIPRAGLLRLRLPFVPIVSETQRGSIHPQKRKLHCLNRFCHPARATRRPVLYRTTGSNWQKCCLRMPETISRLLRRLDRCYEIYKKSERPR